MKTCLLHIILLNENWEYRQTTRHILLPQLNFFVSADDSEYRYEKRMVLTFSSNVFHPPQKTLEDCASGGDQTARYSQMSATLKTQEQQTHQNILQHSQHTHRVMSSSKLTIPVLRKTHSAVDLTRRQDGHSSYRFLVQWPGGGRGGRCRGVFLGCLASQQHADISQGHRICSAATVRQKLQMKLIIPPSQYILTPDQPVLALTL